MIKESPGQMHEYSAWVERHVVEAVQRRFACVEGEDREYREGYYEAYAEGYRQGFQQGELIGRILILQELLGIDRPTRDELLEFTVPKLDELAKHVRHQFDTRVE